MVLLHESFLYEQTVCLKQVLEIFKSALDWSLWILDFKWASKNLFRSVLPPCFNVHIICLLKCTELINFVSYLLHATDEHISYTRNYEN